MARFRLVDDTNTSPQGSHGSRRACSLSYLRSEVVKKTKSTEIPSKAAFFVFEMSVLCEIWTGGGPEQLYFSRSRSFRKRAEIARRIFHSLSGLPV